MLLRMIKVGEEALTKSPLFNNEGKSLQLGSKRRVVPVANDLYDLYIFPAINACGNLVHDQTTSN